MANEITTSANTTWRDYETDGVPSSGAHEPLKSDIRAHAATVQTQIDVALALAATGALVKDAVRVATTANGTLASDFENGDTIDGIVLATSDRILIKDQSTGAENGIYVVAASGAPTRATDADADAELPKARVYVQEGTVNAGLSWQCSNTAVTLETTALTFALVGDESSALPAVTAAAATATAQAAAAAVTAATLTANVVATVDAAIAEKHSISVLLESETDGLVIDTTTGVPATFAESKTSSVSTFTTVDDVLTSSQNVPVRVINSAGVRVWCPHNFYQDSDNPTTKNTTVVSGRQYTVSITSADGTGSLTLSNAATGSVTEGVPVTFTAASTTLTGAVVGNVDTVQVQYGGTALAYVATGVGAERVGVPVTLDPRGNMSVLVEPGRTNYLLNSDAPATQSVSLADGDYCFWVEGSGSCALSGGPTGTATEGSPVTFTLSGGPTSVTFTITGTIDVFQCEQGDYPTSLIYTGAASAVRSASGIELPVSAGPALGSQYIIYVDAYIADGTTTGQFLFNAHNGGGLANYYSMKIEGATLDQKLQVASATEFSTTMRADIVDNQRIRIASLVGSDFVATSVDGDPIGNNGTTSGVSTFTPTILTLGNWFGTYCTGPIYFERIAILPASAKDAGDIAIWDGDITTSNEAYDIFALIGQSNVYSGDTYDSGIDVSNGKQWQMDKEGVVTAADEPLDHPIPSATGNGFGLAFARDYYTPNEAAPRRHVLLLPSAFAGTGFSDNRWNQGDDLYNAAISIIRVALARYPNARLRALLWMQGEREAAIPWTEAAYGVALDAMIAAFRSDLDQQVPVIVGGMRPGWLADDGTRQPVEDALADTPNRVAFTAFADPNTATAVGTSGTGVHYTAAEQRLFAEKWHDAWLTL